MKSFFNGNRNSTTSTSSFIDLNNDNEGNVSQNCQTCDTSSVSITMNENVIDNVSSENTKGDNVSVDVTENNPASSVDSSLTASNLLKDIKLRNINRISVGQININSIRNKFEFLNEIVKGYIDILSLHNGI